MKKITILQVTNSATGTSFRATFENGSHNNISPAQVAGYDTSDLRILDTTRHKNGVCTTFSAANFVGRQGRSGFILNVQ